MPLTQTSQLCQDYKMKKKLLLLLPLMLCADDAALLERVNLLETKIKFLEQQDQHHTDDFKQMEPILEKVEKKSILDKINFSPELELRADSFHYKVGKIGGNENTLIYDQNGNSTGEYRRKEYTKDFDPSSVIKFRLNMNAVLDEQVDFHGRAVFMTSSQSYQRVCILSRDIQSGSVSSAFDMDRAYFDFTPHKGAEDAFTFSFGLLPTTGGTPMQYAQNTQRKSMFPSLVFDMNTYGAIATQKYDKSFVRAIVAKAYTLREAFYPYQCNRENIDNADVIGVYADTKLDFYGDALISGGFNYLHNLKAHPYLGPDVTATNTKVLGDMMTLGLGIDIEKFKNLDLTVFAHSAMSIPKGNGNIDDYQISPSNPSAGLTLSGTTGFSTADYAKGSMVSSNGYAFYTGAKYNVNDSFTLGLEYNYASKYWFSATQGAEDIYNKLSIRGHVGETYGIWKFHKNLYAKLGYMVAKELYTGSGWHFGESVSKDATQQVGYFSLNAKY